MTDMRAQSTTIFRAYLALLVLVLVTLPLSARADAVGLRLAPLKYEQNLTATKPQLGFIDVSNPSDASVTISTSVQGFRQTGTDGNLDYYDNPALVAAIVPDLSTFSLGPREAARVSFTINQSKLPQGGVYAVIFFRTVPVGGAAADSYISQSAKVGTLLILNNGGQPVAGGTMTASAPWWQFGSGLSTELTYTLPPSANVGLEPKLSSQIYPWGTSTTVATGLVLPGASRTFTVSRPGSYFGIIPIKITDALTHKTATAYTIAITGWYQTLVVLLVALGIALGLRYRLRPRDIIDAVAHPLDGLSHRD